MGGESDRGSTVMLVQDQAVLLSGDSLELARPEGQNELFPSGS